MMPLHAQEKQRGYVNLAQRISMTCHEVIDRIQSRLFWPYWETGGKNRWSKFAYNRTEIYQKKITCHPSRNILMSVEWALKCFHLAPYLFIFPSSVFSKFILQYERSLAPASFWIPYECSSELRDFRHSSRSQMKILPKNVSRNMKTCSQMLANRGPYFCHPFRLLLCNLLWERWMR